MKGTSVLQEMYGISFILAVSFGVRQEAPLSDLR